jgi:hypothetical protein
MGMSSVRRVLCLALTAAMLFFGFFGGTPSMAQENTVAGQVVGVSRLAKTIQVEVGQKIEMVKFDDETEGMEYVKVGEASIIEFEQQGAERIARTIKPRLVKLPAGTSEIGNDEVAQLVAKGPAKGNYFIVDSRPAPRYAEGHVPTAVSIPVDLQTAEMLPADKEQLLIFYCGGST